jgi:hypothetical protein
VESGGRLRGGRRVVGRESGIDVGMRLECVGEVPVEMGGVGRGCCLEEVDPC